MTIEPFLFGLGGGGVSVGIGFFFFKHWVNGIDKKFKGIDEKFGGVFRRVDENGKCIAKIEGMFKVAPPHVHSKDAK